jgi:hypothetical protein
MKKRTVAVVLVAVALLLLAGIAMRAGGGATLTRWVASFHGNSGH